MKWFPDKKGLITGLAVAGFGFGALLWIKLAGPWGHLLENLIADAWRAERLRASTASSSLAW